MSEKKVEMGVRLNTEQAHAKLQAFGRGMKNTFSNINRMADATSRHFGMVATTISALGSGLVLKKLFSVKEFAAFDDSMLRLQTNAKLTAAEMKKFRSELTTLISAEGMPIEETGDLAQKLAKAYRPDEVLKILKAGDKLSDVTKEPLTASTEAIDRIVKLYRLSADEADDVAASLAITGAKMDQVNSFMQRGVLKGTAGKEYKDILAIIGAMKDLRITNPKVVMGIEQILDEAQSNPKAFKSAGIDIFKTDPATGKKVKKSVIEILKELQPKLDKFKASVSEETFKKNIESVLGPNSAAALDWLMKNLKVIEDARKKQDEAMKHATPKFDAADKTWDESFNRIRSTVGMIKEDVSFIYDLLNKPVKWFADNPQATKTAAWGTAGLAALLGGGLLYSKGKGAVTDIKGTALGVAKGKAIEAVTGVTPVFVTNWPGAFGPLSAPPQIPSQKGSNLPVPTNAPGKNLPVPKEPAPKGPAANTGRFAKGVNGAAIAMLAMDAMGVDFSMGLPKQEDPFDKFFRDMGAPERWYKNDGGSGMGGSLLDMLNGQSIEELQRTVENKINISVNVDQNGRAITTVDGKNTEVQVMAENRGSFR